MISIQPWFKVQRCWMYVYVEEEKNNVVVQDILLHTRLFGDMVGIA